MRIAVSTALAATIFLILCPPAQCQPVPSREPGSTHIFPAGGQRGTTVKVLVGAECIPPETGFRIWGEGVSAAPALGEKVEAAHEPAPRREPTLIPISYAKEWRHEIAIAADAPLGRKLWHLTCARGGTGGRPFLIGDLPEFIETESNSLPERAERLALPVTVNGRIYGERDLDYYLIPAEAGQVVTCDLMAARLGSPLDAILEVRDETGRRMPVQEIHIGSDPVVAFRAERSGYYWLMVANVNFHGGPEYVYRMTVTTEPYAPYAFPFGGQIGSTAEVAFYTLTGVPDENGESLLPLRKPVTFGSDAPLLAGPAGRPIAGDLPEVIETESNDAAASAMTLAMPATVNGQLLSATDEDWYAFSAEAGHAVSIACVPYPAGGPAMPVLQLSGADGNMLLESNSVELPGHRIALDWRPPADGVYRIRLRDLQYGSRGGPQFIYALSLRLAQPDFTLRLAADFANVMQGAKTQLEVHVERRGGFNGPIDLVADGLPEGVTAEPARIPENQSSGQLVLAAADGAASTDATVRLLGRATIDGRQVERVAAAAHLGHDAEGVSVGPSTVEQVHVTVQHKPVFRLFCQEAYQYAHRGTIHHYAMQVERLNGFTGPIYLQAGDRQNRDMDGVEILPITIAPDQTEVDVPIYFPEDMHINAVSLTQLYTQGYAFFDDAQGRRQSTLVVSEKRNLVRTLPTVVKLKAVDKEVTARPGATVTCKLQLERTSNFPGPMEVELVAPADGVRADAVRIESGRNDAAIEVHFGPDLRPRAGTVLRFRATGKLDGTIPVITEVARPVRWE